MMAKKKSPKQKTAYFIRRKSHVDDTQFVNDNGCRIAFAKAMHASWFMRMFASDQKAKIVRGPLEGDDVHLVDVLPCWLPETVSPQEYLLAIEQTMTDIVSKREPSRCAAQSFLKRQKAKQALQ